MVAHNENFAPENPALGSKNRVGNFFGGVGDRAEMMQGPRNPKLLLMLSTFDSSFYRKD